MKTIIKSIFVFFILLGNLCFAQLIQVTSPNMHSEAPIYKNEKGELYSTVLTFKYGKKLADVSKGISLLEVNKILFPEFVFFLDNLKTKYGRFFINKVVPGVEWGDTLKLNKRTKQLVRVVDLSQIYKIQFEKPIPIDSATNLIKMLPNILYTEGPIIAYLTINPDDTWYLDNNYRWSFDAINAEHAWDITTGSSNIRVGMNDSFGGVNQLHNELNGKVVWNNLSGDYGGHGIVTAGVVGALTNNGTGIASLGWNTSVMLDNRWGSYDAVNSIYDLVNNHNADIINFSWVSSYYYKQLADAILYALQSGVVCVASAGNTEYTVPDVRYPACYNYGTDGQVIAVSATILNSGTEQFLDSFNYSPGNDPINDPTNAFIDFTAPGSNYRALSDVSVTDYVHIWAATSVSSPFVSALVALMYSINNALTPNQVYNILRASTDKVDQSRHPDNANGWNRWTGYGRINAYKALKYTLEHYGGSLTQSLTIPSGETWNFQPGVTVNFASGTYLRVNGTLNAVGTSSNPITFTRSGTTGTWGGISFNNGSSGNLQYCTIQYGEWGIYCFNSSPSIAYCRLENNQNAGVNLYYYSNSSLYYNTIQNNYSGIVCGDHSSPNMLYPGHNVIRSNNAAGVAASNYSNPQIGSSSGYGNNSIYNNSGSSISAHIYCTINAQNNYWGGGNPVVYTSGSSVVNYLPILTTDPNSGRALIAPTEISQNDVTISYNMQGGDELSAALDKLKDKKYDEAIQLFLEFFKNNKEALLGKYALCKIEECFTQAGKKDFLDYSKKELRPLIKTLDETFVVLLELETHQLVNARLYKEAMDNLFLIKDEYNLNEEIDKHTLYRIGVFYSDLFGDKKNAKKYFDEFKIKYPNDDLVNDIDHWMNIPNVISNSGSYIAVAQAASETHTAGNVGVSVENYPNPFNPTTRISFTIPEKGNVKLRVFDPLGREITILADGVYEVGKYEVSFDAHNLPSGVYFYNLATGSNSISKKMLLVK